MKRLPRRVLNRERQKLKSRSWSSLLNNLPRSNNLSRSNSLPPHNNPDRYPVCHLLSQRESFAPALLHRHGVSPNCLARPGAALTGSKGQFWVGVP